MTRFLAFVFLLPFLSGHPVSAETKMTVQVAADDALILHSGRMEKTGTGEIQQGYSGARIRFAFEGTSIAMRMTSNPFQNWFNVFIDGKWLTKIKVVPGRASYELAANLGEGTHTLELVRATECSQGVTVFKGFSLSEGGKALPWPDIEKRKIEFIGDSITCGYGIEVDDPSQHFNPDTENFCHSYAYLAARALKADYLVVARSGIGMYRNYNGPPEGSKESLPALYEPTFFKQAEPIWDPSGFIPDVVCVNLGTNDFSTKGADPERYEAAYIAFAGKLKSRYPSAKFVFLIGPMENRDHVKTIVQRVAEKADEGQGRVSFFELSAQGAHGFGADSHPSRKQGEVNGKELAGYLSHLMQWPQEEASPVIGK